MPSSVLIYMHIEGNRRMGYPGAYSALLLAHLHQSAALKNRWSLLKTKHMHTCLCHVCIKRKIVITFPEFHLKENWLLVCCFITLKKTIILERHKSSPFPDKIYCSS